MDAPRHIACGKPKSSSTDCGIHRLPAAQAGQTTRHEISGGSSRHEYEPIGAKATHVVCAQLDVRAVQEHIPLNALRIAQPSGGTAAGTGGGTVGGSKGMRRCAGGGGWEPRQRHRQQQLTARRTCTQRCTTGSRPGRRCCAQQTACPPWWRREPASEAGQRGSGGWAAAVGGRRRAGPAQQRAIDRDRLQIAARLLSAGEGRQTPQRLTFDLEAETDGACRPPSQSTAAIGTRGRSEQQEGQQGLGRAASCKPCMGSLVEHRGLLGRAGPQHARIYSAIAAS